MQCSFCHAEIGRGVGLAFVRRDGTMLYFCSRRCKQDLLVLRRNPRKMKWVRKLSGEGKEKAEKETKQAKGKK